MQKLDLSKEAHGLLLPAALLLVCSIWLQTAMTASYAAFGAGNSRLNLCTHIAVVAVAFALALVIARLGLHRMFLRLWYIFPIGLVLMLLVEAPPFQPSRSCTFLVFRWWHGAPATALMIIAVVATLAFALPRLCFWLQCGVVASVALLALALPVWLRYEAGGCCAGRALTLIQEGGWVGGESYILLTALQCEWGCTFSQLCGAGGLLAAIIALTVTALMLTAAWRIVWRQRNAHHRALAGCCAVALTLQPLLHLCANLGLYPTRLPIHYPFLANGLTLLLLDGTLLGLLLALDNESVKADF